jgi:hypothetical protein
MPKAIKRPKARSNAKGSTGSSLTARQSRELAEIAALADEQIDNSDIPELPPAAWKDAGSRQVLSAGETGCLHASRRRRRGLAEEIGQGLPDPSEPNPAPAHAVRHPSGLNSLAVFSRGSVDRYRPRNQLRKLFVAQTHIHLV